jgi:hypothetical protein
MGTVVRSLSLAPAISSALLTCVFESRVINAEVRQPKSERGPFLSSLLP